MILADSDDDPTFFIGSCQRLIAELDDLKRNSPLRLGDVVSEYSDMRADFLTFVRSDTELNLSTDDCVRWIWRALRDGAELAIAENSALWAGPDSRQRPHWVGVRRRVEDEVG